MTSLLNKIQTKPTILPPRIVIHGPEKVGKTRLAADAEGVVFLPLEDGLATLSVPAFPQPADLADVMQALSELATEKHSYKVVAIDTIDKLEPLVWNKVCEADGKEDIESFGYGKGYIKCDSDWIAFFHALDALRARGMTIIVLSHTEARNIEDPQVGAYTRFMPKLHKRATALMHEWADVIGYLDIERVPIDKGDSKKRVTRTSTVTGQRVLHLDPSGGFVAGNRYGLPSSLRIPLEHPYQMLRAEILKALGVADKPKSKEAA